jgi:hypothetical protein
LRDEAGLECLKELVARGRIKGTLKTAKMKVRLAAFLVFFFIVVGFEPR